MTTLRTPIAKLPLTARKNIRDEYESKKPEYETAMRDILGEPWTIALNPNLLYSYASDDYKSRLGSVITWYFDAFASNLKRFVEKFGQDGVQELNSTCSKHQLVLAPQDKTSFTYGGLVVEDGELRLVFAEDCFAVNVDDVSEDFSTALDGASASAKPGNALNLTARNAVRTDYDPKIEPLRSAIAGLVNMPQLKLNPNFEATAALLAQSKGQVEDDWDKRIGWIVLEYFDSLKYILEREKFKDDDMQQEAFQEAVEMGEVCFRLLPEWEDDRSRYNEVKVDEGVLYIQTTVQNWGSNTGDACLKLLDVL